MVGHSAVQLVASMAAHWVEKSVAQWVLQRADMRVVEMVAQKDIGTETLMVVLSAV